VGVRRLGKSLYNSTIDFTPHKRHTTQLYVVLHDLSLSPPPCLCVPSESTTATKTRP
jgi:hypothetical protein